MGYSIQITDIDGDKTSVRPQAYYKKIDKTKFGWATDNNGYACYGNALIIGY